MHRRRFLKSLAAAPPALLAASCAGGGPRKRVVYAGGFSLPKSIDEELWLELEARVERELPGHDVRLLIRGETGPEESTFAALRRGRIQFAGGSFAGVATLVPEIAMLSLPFFYDSVDEVDFVMDRYMLEPFRRLFAAKGIRVLHWTEIGWVSLYGRAPLRKPGDTRGVRIRASTSIASQAFIEEIGADMITMPFSDVLPALQTGLIDAGVTSTMMYSLSGIPKVAPNFVLTRHSYDMGVAMASEKWFRTLDAREQAVYAQGLGDVADARRRARARVDALLEQLPKQGVQIYEPTAEEREAWRAAARPSYEKLVRQAGGESRRIYEALLEGKDAWRRSQAAAAGA
jgi:TRAP-type C4-dicarboxylate transport system substrate-binding protein